jgi:hypothetical protein
VVNSQPALAHLLFEVAESERVPAVPADAQEDARRLEVSPLERRLILLQEYKSRRVIDEPEKNNSSKAIPSTEPFVATARTAACTRWRRGTPSPSRPG